MITNESYEALLSQIGKLDKDTADVLLLRLVYGYRYPEIGEMLHITQETARARVSRGRKHLRLAMGKEGGQT